MIILNIRKLNTCIRKLTKFLVNDKIYLKKLQDVNLGYLNSFLDYLLSVLQ